MTKIDKLEKAAKAQAEAAKEKAEAAMRRTTTKK